MGVLLLSTYELGRQPFGLASPAAWLRRAGVDVTCLDLSRQPLELDQITADLIAVHLPMHTATRLALPVIRRVRERYPEIELCCYGLYAPLNDELLRSLGVRHIVGGEFEQRLVEIATHRTPPLTTLPEQLPRLKFVVPDRTGLPPPDCYATLRVDGYDRLVGYTEASRGCKHLCRHCPVVPVYNGRFRVVPVDVILDDVRRQVAQGVEHITFGDPDFLNGIGHATRVIDRFATEFPDVTYDVTIKVEHLRRHPEILPRLRETGCLFVTSAVESFNDAVLSRLRKGHTRTDVVEVVASCRAAGVTLAPTFLAFTPWTTLDGYCDFLASLDELDLVPQVAPIQLALRLLVPHGSRLLELPDLAAALEPFDPVKLVYPWRHADPRVDALCDAVGAVVSQPGNASRAELFARIWSIAHTHLGQPRPAPDHAGPGRAEIPYLNEPWYC